MPRTTFRDRANRVRRSPFARDLRRIAPLALLLAIAYIALTSVQAIAPITTLATR